MLVPHSFSKQYRRPVGSRPSFDSLYYGLKRTVRSPSCISTCIHMEGLVRRPTQKESRSRCPLRLEFKLLLNSTKRTSEARTFVLAIKPQYFWYTPPFPEKARAMNFGALLFDCFDQARKADLAALPRLTKGAVGHNSTLTGSVEVINSIPTPDTLGDLVKLSGSTATDMGGVIRLVAA